MNIASFGDTELKIEFHQRSKTAWVTITEGNSELTLYAGNYITADQLRRVAEILNEPVVGVLTPRELLDDEIRF